LKTAEIESDNTLTGLQKLNKIRELYDLPPYNQTAIGIEVIDRTIEERIADSYPDEDEAYEIISKGI
jgi:hypothetical protein